MDYINRILIITILLFPFIGLIFNSILVVRNKKSNRSTVLNIVIIVLSLLFIMLPFVLLLIDKDGLSFFMLIVAECFVLGILIPWLLLAFVVFLITKSKKTKFSKERNFISTVIVIILFFGVCYGTFSGFFFSVINKLIGGPPMG